MKLTKWKTMNTSLSRERVRFAFFPTRIYEGRRGYARYEFTKTRSCWIWLESFKKLEWRGEAGDMWYVLARVETSFK